MGKWLKYFLQGLAFLAPIYFSLYFVYRVFISSDGLFGRLLTPLGLDYPGLGIIFAFIVISATGILISHAISKRFVRWVDRFFNRLPIVKLLYSMIKDVINSMGGERKAFGDVVKVEIAGGISVLGFKTKDLENDVAVYIPQAYHFAGFVIIVPKDKVTPVNISVGEAMKFILSAGLTGDLTILDGKE
ncbi:MAG: DUF502 domain-containing protein [Bacillota bacterium]